MAEMHVCHPGAFLLTFGQHRFEVYIGDTLVKASGYWHPWEAAVMVAPGSHRLEIRGINKITGSRRSSFFNFDVSRESTYRLHLSVSHAWGSWRQPRLEAVTPSDSAQQPPSAPEGARG